MILPFRLPYKWKPRLYQWEAWDYLQQGGKHCELVWHRRSGKDEVSLHRTACAAFERTANYWHMLPLATQVRKAIWEAVNPFTGKRRIDEAFPPFLRETTREQEMFIKFKNGSTWQALGSDNFQAAIGSTPAGIVYSEWSQANPSARGYLRPILAENDGWQVYITTPRGKNHAHRTFKAAQKNPKAFAQILTIDDTGILGPERLKEELEEYVSTYGEDMGNALYQQEYYCSFDAAILGAFYGSEFARIDRESRIRRVDYDPTVPVHTAWDIGRTDDTAIWWYQVVAGEIHVLEYIADAFKDPDYFASQILGIQVSIDIINSEVIVHYGAPIHGLEHRRAYKYGKLNLPHDARAKTFAAMGKSIHEQFAKVFGWDAIQIVPELSFVDGIQASRMALNRAYFNDTEDIEEGTEALRQYEREWDDDKKCFRDKHNHNWCSHPADAWRMLAVAWQDEKPKPKDIPPKFPVQRTFAEMVEHVKHRRLGEDY